MRSLALGVAMLSLAAPAGARGTCTIEGKAALPFTVEVAPREAAPFKLRVSGVAAAIAPGGVGGQATARIKGPLAFEGRVATDEVPARTSRPTEALNGLLRLAPGSDKLTLHANVRARIVDAEARVGGVVFRGLALPCDALTLDAVPDPPLRLGREHPDAPHFVAAGKLVHVRGQPGGGAAMEVALDEPDELELRQSEASGAWLHVTAEWPDGTLVTGWVKRDELKPAGMPHERIGETPPRAPSCAEAVDGPRTAVVDVKAGTQLYGARYLGPWGKVVDGAKLTVRYSPKDDWIQIVRVPNVAAVGEGGCPALLDNAWIPRAAASATAP